MSVINGQLANQTTFNNAFMSRTAATTSTVAKMALSNTDLESGAVIVNTQRAINKLFEGVGATGEADTTVNDYANNNYIADGDSRKVAIEKLDAQLKATQDDLDDHKTNVNAHPQYLTEPEADLLYDTLGSAQAVADSLSNVTNDAQLKRAAGDFNSFTEKATGEDDDIVLIEDSADSFNKKKMKLSQVLGGGSGSGQINFLTNPDGLTGTTGWTEGSFAAASRPSGTFTPSSGAGAFAISSTSTTPLGVGTTSLLLTKSSGASRQGRAVVSDFVLPIDYRAKVLSIDINYIINSGTFVAGSNSADSSLIWYCAFSNDNGATYTVVEPSSFKLLSNSTTISDRFRASIQTPYDATNMRLIAYIAETANSAWVVECIASVSPSEYVYGTPITDWQSYTPTWSGSGGTPSLGNGTLSGRWRRVGDSAEFQIYLLWGSTTSGNSSNQWIFSRPTGLNLDLSKLANNNTLSHGGVFITDSGTQFYAGVPEVIPAGIRFMVTAGATIGTTVPFTWATNDNLIGSGAFPVLGWSSSVQMSDSADTRVVAAALSKSSIQTGINPNGSSVKLTIDSAVDGDTHGGLNVANSRYIVQVPGWYRLGGFSYFTPTNVLNNLYYSEIWINGSSSIIGHTVYQPAGTAFGASVNGLRYLKAGDYIELYLYGLGNNSVSTISATIIKLNIERLSGPQAIAATETIACRYTSTAGQSIPHSATTTVNFATKTFDTHGSWDGNHFRVPASGKYDLFASFQYAVASQGGTIFGFIYRNGVNVSRNYIFAVDAAPYVVTVFDTLELDAGDLISFRTYHNAGSSRNLDTDITGNRMFIKRIGL